MTILIYGATGYTGRLCAEHAAERGLRPVLAGRNSEKIRSVAEGLGLEWRVFGLAPSPAQLRGVKAVLHAAGPFSATAALMASACIEAGVHYCDITGEIDVFEALAAWDARARAAGVMLLPGAGFDVVPSDCLASHVATLLPGATRLRLSIGGLSKASRGTMKTMLEGIGAGVRVRRSGSIVQGDPRLRQTADFGDRLRPTIGVPWGDVATAWRSTGIPNIDVFFEATREMQFVVALPAAVRKLISAGPVLRFLQGRIDRHLPPGPSDEDRTSGRAAILAEAWDVSRQHVSSLLTTPEPYHLTARTAVEVARLAAAGSAVPGYQTPSTAYGAGFVLKFEGVERSDADAARHQLR